MLEWVVRRFSAASNELMRTRPLGLGYFPVTNSWRTEATSNVVRHAIFSLTGTSSVLCSCH